MDQKGVSPLIATIILVAFVVAIAALMSQFLTGFQQQRQTEISAEGETLITCSLAAFEIDEDTVTYTFGTKDLILTLENTGRTDLSILEIVYLNNTDKITETATATKKNDNSRINTTNPFKVGTIMTIHNNTVGYRPDKITVTSSCAGVTASAQNNTAKNEWERVFD